MNKIIESQIEQFAIEVLKSQGWQYVHGLAIGPGAEYAERESFEQIILTQRLRKSVARLNRYVSADAPEQAVQNGAANLFTRHAANKRNPHPCPPAGYAAAEVDERGSESKLFGVMIFMIYTKNMTDKQEVQNAFR